MMLCHNWSNMNGIWNNRSSHSRIKAFYFACDWVICIYLLFCIFKESIVKKNEKCQSEKAVLARQMKQTRIQQNNLSAVQNFRKTSNELEMLCKEEGKCSTVIQGNISKKYKKIHIRICQWFLDQKGRDKEKIRERNTGI